MPQPKGQKRIPGHALREMDGRAACECGWKPSPGFSPSRGMVERGRHLVDVRMAAAE
jgi:hypothetical protein